MYTFVCSLYLESNAVINANLHRDAGLSQSPQSATCTYAASDPKLGFHVRDHFLKSRCQYIYEVVGISYWIAAVYDVSINSSA